MVLETVKATYDTDTKRIYIKLTDKKVDMTVRSQYEGYHARIGLYDIDKDNQLVGIEVLLS